MALTASAKSNTVSTPPPAGAHIARCVRVIDLGVQKDEGGKFGPKCNQKLLLTWELPNELHTFKEEEGPQPFHVTSEYTVFLSEKANLRKHLESWRGRPFTAAELEAFDVGKLLGAPCLLNVIHKTGSNGNTYGNVASLSPMPKGMQCPPAITEPVKYEIEQGRDAVFASLPEWIQNKIAKCENWKAKPKAHETTTAPDPSDYADANADSETIPF